MVALTALALGVNRASYAERQGATVAPEALDGLLQRYRAENRELRACEPRDLIERARDICRFRGSPLELSAQVLDLAWAGYFGVAAPVQQGNGAGEVEAIPAEGLAARGPAAATSSSS